MAGAHVLGDRLGLWAERQRTQGGTAAAPDPPGLHNQFCEVNVVIQSISNC